LSYGPGLLVTHDCHLDKRTKAGVPKADRFQFIPLLDLGAASTDRRALLKKEELVPSEGLFVGTDVAGIQEAYGLLSEIYTLPATYFAPQLQFHPGDQGADDDGPHLVATANGDRVGRLEDERLQLLREKLILFFFRAKVAEIEN
jgi:hypothetical protein